ncbi:MAG: sigma-70 family RNA polymerase sigma factor, partial [Microbacterium sp.]
STSPPASVHRTPWPGSRPATVKTIRSCGCCARHWKGCGTSSTATSTIPRSYSSYTSTRHRGRPVRAARRALRESLDRLPTLTEISDATGRPVARVEQVLAFDRDVIDLDAAAELTGDDVRWAHRPDVDVEESLDRARLCDQVLSLLTDRESAILRRRCGYDTGREETLEEIGQSFGVTRERIRQIEAKAKRKIVEALAGQAG